VENADRHRRSLVERQVRGIALKRHRRRTPSGRSYNTRKFLKKLGARLASPQPRPASPVNGAGGITGCGKDAQAFGSFQPGPAFFQIFSRPLFVSEMAYF
jgi:hypothetical protein